MADVIRLVEPKSITPNPENPRLIFRKEDMDALQASIEHQGILVPLTVYESGSSGNLVILDGERRWRCALKLGLNKVPVVVQPEPNRMQNIMMMFAIHHARTDWDPLPTAYKLRDLENEFRQRQGREPGEPELAELASLTRGEVRRLKRVLELPDEYREQLLAELEKPRSHQVLSVDHVLEATRGAAALEKRGVVGENERERLTRSIIGKFKTGVEKNTVAPRQLARIARAVERNEVSRDAARAVAIRLISDAGFTIEQAFKGSVERVDFEHSVEQVADRLRENLEEHLRRGYEVGASLSDALSRLRKVIGELLAR